MIVAAGQWRHIAAAAVLASLAPWAWAGLLDGEDKAFLTVDQAFVPQAVATQKAIVVSWQIADGYYLYRHALSFEPPPNSVLKLGSPEIPPGEAHRDEFFGEVETYRQRLTVTVPVDHWPQDGPVHIVVGYQGCADAGLCYPPQTRTLTAIFSAGGPAGALAPTREQRAGNSTKAGFGWGLAALLVAGLLLTATLIRRWR